MTAEHTPGPWTGFLHERAPGEAAWLIGPSSARPIVAAVQADEEAGLTGAVVEANARLVAAAPNLLKWAKAFQQHLIIEQGNSFDELDDDIAGAEGAHA